MEQHDMADDDGLLSDVTAGPEWKQLGDHTSSIMVHSLDSQSEYCEPEIGMSFTSAEAVKSFYCQYAARKGFRVMIRNSRRGGDGKLQYYILACSRGGTYVSRIPKGFKRYQTIKNNCPARITVALNADGLWYIHATTINHNHELSPNKSKLFHGNKNRSMHVKRTIQINDETSVRLNETHHSLIHGARGYENVSFVGQDVRNFMGTERHKLGKEGDGKALLSYFVRMQQDNSNFFYEIDLDDDFHMKNVFWADARSRAAYEYFGDVVSFDTTYLKNKYDLPFAPFVGVNHHGQSILLGCGLLATEDTDTFTWLFQSWLHCMSGKTPKGIVTDQCKAMQNAIELVFPHAQHRWCLWHIMKKIPEMLKGFAEYKNIKDAMEIAVYDSLTDVEFEGKWSTFIEKFGLGDNEWLTGLYKERSKWVPCHIKNNFWAGMSTTQRSESIHAFFDGYIDATTTLQQFVGLYDNVLYDKAGKEYEADCRSFNTTIPCASNSVIERQFQVEYTHAKFNEVQAEFRAKMNCCVCSMCMDGTICSYDVMEELFVVGHPKEAIFHVVFNRNNHDINCSCLLFEFKGIMCRHSLLVLAQERVKQVPPKYVLSRWSKKIRRKHMYIKSSFVVKQLHPQMQRFDTLCQEFYAIAEVAAEFPDATEMLQHMIHEVKDKVQAVATSNQDYDSLYDDE